MRLMHPANEEDATLEDAVFNVALGVLAVLPAWVGRLPDHDFGSLLLVILALAGGLWALAWGFPTFRRVSDWVHTRDYRREA